MTEQEIREIRKDFPFFASTDAVYLDNSATTQRPKPVMDALLDFSYYKNANPFRGLYPLSTAATEAYEEARGIVADFIGAASSREIIFTRNASESLNLLGYSLGSLLLGEGDEVIVTVAEHHSNMLPWRAAAERAGAKVRYLNPDSEGHFSVEELEKLLSERTKIVAMTAMSNVFGELYDVSAFAAAAHKVGAVFVADGAQSVPHTKTDVKKMNCDFLAFSGHKLLSPMGIGVLYGKEEWLEKLPVFMTGGEMIEYITLDDISYAELPHRFEAGTVNAGDAVALGAAIRYLEGIGTEKLEEREAYLTKLAIAGMQEIPYVTLVGSPDPANHHGILTFRVEGVHPHDTAEILAGDGICIRAGHHCTQPLHQYLRIQSTNRASLMFYNTEEEIERFLTALRGIRRKMGYAE